MSRRASFLFAFVVVLLSSGLRFALPALGWSRLETRKLPGFTLGLPHGKALRDDQQYAHGVFLVGVDEMSGVVGASWTPSDGEPMTPSELEGLAQAFAAGIGPIPSGKATPVDFPGPDGKPLGGVRIGDNMLGTIATCGARQIVIMTMANRGGERLHRRVLRSFACTPDAAQETALHNLGSALLLDLPGWRLMTQNPNLIQLTDGRVVLMLMPNLPTNIETQHIQKVLGPFMQTQGVAMTFAPPRDGRVDFTIKSGKDIGIGWARLFDCAERHEVMMAITDSAAAADSLYTRLDKTRCRRPDEPAQVWPGPTTP